MSIVDKSNQNLIDYQKAYKKCFKQDLSLEEANNSFNNLMGFIRTLDKINRRIKLEDQIKQKYLSSNKKLDKIETESTNMQGISQPVKGN